MENVVSLKAVRTFKDCERLFVGYKNRLVNMSQEEIAKEIIRFQSEMHNYPNHLLTLVKGRILLKSLIARGSKIENTHKLLETIEERIETRRRDISDDQRTRA